MSLIKETNLYNYKATVERLVDADTVDVSIDLGFDIHHKTRLRLMGIDAPERFTDEGKAATAWLAQQLPIGHEVTVSTFKDKAGKFGRILAIITYNGLDMNQELVKNGHAVEYDGGKR